MICGITMLSLTLLGDIHIPLSWVNSQGGDLSRLNYVSPNDETPVSQIAYNDLSPVAPSLAGSWISQRPDFAEAANRVIAAAATRASALQAIEDLKNLPPDWGGADTILPSPEVRSAAKALLLGLGASVPTPHVSPSADGEIGFAWLIGTKRVESILAPDGQLVWFWTESNKVLPGGEAAFNGSFPDDLVELVGGAGT